MTDMPHHNLSLGLIALVALYRPGPVGYSPVYGRRKAGGEQVQYRGPRMERNPGTADHRRSL
jgi:DNA polymerase III alpha subunit